MSQKKRGLGKGLSALISDKNIVDTILNEEVMNDNIINLHINDIISKEDQPRKYFDDEALADLADSIKIHGVIQPIVVRKLGNKYEIVAGERRWRASKKLGLEKIPSIVKEIDQETAAKISLIENVQRENLNPIEEAMAFQNLMKEYSLKQEDLAKAMGKSRTYISNTTRLLNLHEEIIEYIINGELTSGHGKALLGIKDKDKQLKAAQKIIENNLSVRDAESGVKLQNTSKKDKNRNSNSNKDSYIIDLEEELMRYLGTKVNLVIGNKKGKIEIEYYGDSDLERLIDLLRQ